MSVFPVGNRSRADVVPHVPLCPRVALPACPMKDLRKDVLNKFHFLLPCPPAGDQRCDQGLGAGGGPHGAGRGGRAAAAPGQPRWT